MVVANALQQFFVEDNGKVICIADDLSLYRIVRHALSPHAVDSDESVFHHQEAESAFRVLDEYHVAGIPCMVLIERVLAGVKTTDVVLRMRRLFPDVCLFVVGSNITKEIAAYFYEMGARALISKPVSAEAVLGKMLSCVERSREQHLTTYVRECIASANASDAVEAVDKYLALHPESSLAYCLKGDALLADGDYPEAIEAFTIAMRLNLHFTEPLKRLAAVYKHTNDDKALEFLGKLDAISPFNPDRKLEMGEIQLRKGAKEKAVKLFDVGFKQASQEFSLLLGDFAERIALIVSDQIPDLAEEYLAKAIETKTVFTLLDLQMFNKLGMLLRNRGDWAAAVDVYKKALDIAPSDPVLYYNMALAYYDGRKARNVRECLSKAFSLDRNYYKNNEGVSYNVGSMLLEYGDKAAAKVMFEQVLKLNPANEKAGKKLEQCQKSSPH